MKSGFLAFSLVQLFTIMLLSCMGNNSQEKNASRVLTADSFALHLKNENNPQLIDVRTPEEFAAGHIEGARNYNWNGDNFSEQITALDKGRPVYLYCRSGKRSAAAAEMLNREGFEKVYDLKGGMLEWQKTFR